MPVQVSSTICSSSGGQIVLYSIGIITPVDGSPVHLCTGRPPTGLMLPDAV